MGKHGYLCICTRYVSVHVEAAEEGNLDFIGIFPSRRMRVPNDEKENYFLGIYVRGIKIKPIYGLEYLTRSYKERIFRHEAANGVVGHHAREYLPRPREDEPEITQNMIMDFLVAAFIKVPIDPIPLTPCTNVFPNHSTP